MAVYKEIIYNDSNLLYLSGCASTNADNVLVSCETFITFFVYQYCDLKLPVCIVDREDKYSCCIPKTSFDNVKFIFHEKEFKECIPCSFPCIISEEEKTTIAGLCAVLRWAIKSHLLEFPDHYSKELLGFRGGCLVACTESSIWTKFCELELPRTVEEISSKIRLGHLCEEVPKNLLLLEAHLKRPVRTHNILKRKLDLLKEIKNKKKEDNNKLILEADFTLYDKNNKLVQDSLEETIENMMITEKSNNLRLNHNYLEGIDLTLADVIVFPCVYYLLYHLPAQAHIHLTNVLNWYRRMWSQFLVQRAAKKVGINSSIHKNCKNEESLSVSNVEQISLYKRDSLNTKFRCKHQNPDGIISFLLAENIHPIYHESSILKLDWNSIPSDLHPEKGDLPQKRLDRKCQQLESIVSVVLSKAKDGDKIVEFCSGGGHVGLLIAYFLPYCQVFLIENKESSMMRAKTRAKNLNMKNVYFYQCNLDYFTRSFDIGVSLHACGVVTDLVLQQCIKNRASFVCCPCCYGNIQDIHSLNYPLSQKFQSTHLSKKDYRLLAHFADRNEINTPVAKQGEVCMGLIDTDRVYYAEEQGYNVVLTTLQPVTCSPKHNLLIGVPNL